MAAAHSPSPSPRSSARRIAANQENAKKSTGPRTPAGKRRSRFNAVKHGLTASIGLLPGEDAAALRDLSRAVHADLRPCGQAESVLVDQYVSIAWKLRRLGAAERMIAGAELLKDLAHWVEGRETHDWALKQPALREEVEREGPPPFPDGKSGAELMVENLAKGTGPLMRLMELEMRLRGTLTGVLKQLKDLRALRRQQLKDEQENDQNNREPWEPGAWDEGPQRWGPNGEKEGDEGEDEDEGLGKGPATAQADEANDEEDAPAPPPPAQNQPSAAAAAPPAVDVAQVEVAAPVAPPSPNGDAVKLVAPCAQCEPTKASGSGPLSGATARQRESPAEPR